MTGAGGRLGALCGGGAAAAAGADLVVLALLIQSRVLEPRHASAQVSAQVQKDQKNKPEASRAAGPRSDAPNVQPEPSNQDPGKNKQFPHFKGKICLLFRVIS